MDPSPLELFPLPRRARRVEERCPLTAPPRVEELPPAGGEGVAALASLAEDTAARAGGGRLRLRLEGGVAPAASASQGYRLVVGGSGILVAGSTAAALAHGLATFRQWLALHRQPGSRHDPPALAGLEVEDWPDFPRRGVMIDISRDRVPTMESFLLLVELLADWKINELQLYTEHTFAYEGHEIVWRGASPMTPEEIRRLDAHCRDHFIELVPNQNSFGHFHRWLRHAPYRHLAESPAGVDHPFSPRREPFSLCPTDPASLELLAGLYDQLLPCFTSRMFNVGCDETFDLGLGRSAAACAERGKGRVYLDFLRQIHRLAAERGRRIQFWGDILLEHPELVERGEVPGDAIALLWGYEGDHPFAEQARRIAASGLEFYVCPGTSGWNSLAGRGANALTNIAAAARVGAEHGARGLLVTDWGDNGHLQPPPVSWPGLLLAAGFAWNAGAAADAETLDMPALLGRQVFADPTSLAGRALWELSNTYLLPGPRPKNGSVLFHLLLSPDQPLDHPRYRGLTAAGLEAARDHIAAALAPLAASAMARPDAELIRAELSWVGRALDLACRLGLARLAARNPRPLAAELDDLVEPYRALWLARSRPGGLDDSAARLERARDALRREG